MWGLVSPPSQRRGLEGAQDDRICTQRRRQSWGGAGGGLLALLERNIRPDLIVGTSVGALNGVALASNPTPEGARWIAESWRNVRRTDIFPGNSLTVGWRLLIGRGSLHAQDAFYRFVRSMLSAHVERFADLRVPCVVTATVLSSGQLRLFGADPQERVVDAIMASTAIPPFFSALPLWRRAAGGWRGRG